MQNEALQQFIDKDDYTPFHNRHDERGSTYTYR